MLFLLIPLAWLLVSVFFVLLCRAAAAGDRDAERPQLSPRVRRVPTRIFVRDLEHQRVRVPSAGAHPTGELRLRTVRARGLH